MTKFYSFQWAQNKNEILIESLIKYDDRQLKRGDLILKTPFATKSSEGKKLYDIVHFQDPFNFAISEKVFNLLNGAKITGWRSYEITIEGRSEKYHGVQILGKCGALKRPDEPGFILGCQFEYDTWDGSDFFMPVGTLKTFCTEKVKILLTSNKITNLELQDISTIEWYST
jgi:hypothetical protein